MPDELLVRFCAPTLASLKTGSLFSCEDHARAALYDWLRSLNRRLGDKGLRVLPLRYRQGRCLVYVYRPSLLRRDLAEEGAVRILRACGLRRSGVNLISCTTCGRTAYDMIPLAEELERRLEDCDKPITVAVMGCVVNGPGEASAADIGVAGGKGEGLIFRHGEVLYKVAQEKLLDALLEEIEKL